jgi:nucleotide-binding universal stress UspA family protein
MFKHMLIPTDGSSASVRAIEAGVNLAKALDARITFLAVLNPWKLFSLDPLVVKGTTEKQYLEESARIGRMRVNVGEELAKSKGVQANGVLMYEDDPWKAIVDESTRLGCDLIAMASHGHKGTVAMLIGSETLKVLTHASIPVLVMK